MTAQVTALYPGFLAAALAAGVPPLLAALPLAYFSNLNAAMTHYGTGPRRSISAQGTCGRATGGNTASGSRWWTW